MWYEHEKHEFHPDFDKEGIKLVEDIVVSQFHNGQVTRRHVQSTLARETFVDTTGKSDLTE